jgi:rhodanese-related sulfurtransferase
MFEIVKRLFGIAGTTEYKRLVEEGAKIIDVRTPEEYHSGHIPDSINIPLSLLSRKIGKVGKEEQIILCCRSGMRSNSARSVLLSLGYVHVYDGGSWISLMTKVK